MNKWGNMRYVGERLPETAPDQGYKPDFPPVDVRLCDLDTPAWLFQEKVYADGSRDYLAVRGGLYAGMPVQGMGVPKGTKREKTSAEKSEESEASSLKRSRRVVRERVRMIEGDHLVTLTYRKNMMSVLRAKRDWDSFRRKILAEIPDWRYVVVLERQKRGAIHFHAAVKGRQDVDLLRRVWYSIVGEAQGQVDISSPSKRWGSRTYKWNTSKLCGYLCKYMSKGFTVANGSRRYWSSRDIPPPLTAVRFIDMDGCTDFFDVVRLLFSHVAGFRNHRFYASPAGSFWLSASL